jgi:hypothetical protein
LGCWGSPFIFVWADWNVMLGTLLEGPKPLRRGGAGLLGATEADILGV